MPTNVRRVDYFYATVKDRPGEAYRLLSKLATEKVNLLAFNAIPVGFETTQLLILPDTDENLAEAAETAEISLNGPHHAFLIQGDDQPGVLASLHRKLFDAEVNVYASHGVTDGRGGYGYVLYVRAEDYESAANALGV